MIAIWGYNKTHLLTDILFFRYISYSQSPELREFMRATLDPDALIVQVGCGNSKLGVNLFEDGFRFLINIDISRAVLAQMQAKYRKQHPGLAFIAGDATALRWPDACVDAIVDKGTLQSLLLLADGMAKVEAFAREVWRILRPGGKMIQILGAKGMQIYLRQKDLPWAVKHKAVPRKGIGGMAHVYTFTKPHNAAGGVE